jgi:hypothetical protein
MSALPRWKRLYEAALAENDALVLKTRLRAAEIAMTSSAQAMLNSKEGQSEYEELMVAMRSLYEHALRNGVNVPGGTFKH